MTNEKLQELKAAQKRMRENIASHAAFTEYKKLLFLHSEALIAKVESLAADAERWKKFERALRNHRIPGTAHGRRFKIVEICPISGDEEEFNDFTGAIDAMAKEKA